MNRFTTELLDQLLKQLPVCINKMIGEYAQGYITRNEIVYVLFDELYFGNLTHIHSAGFFMNAYYWDGYCDKKCIVHKGEIFIEWNQYEPIILDHATKIYTHDKPIKYFEKPEIIKPSFCYLPYHCLNRKLKPNPEYNIYVYN